MLTNVNSIIATGDVYFPLVINNSAFSYNKSVVMSRYIYADIFQGNIILNNYRIVCSSQVNGAIIQFAFAFVVIPTPVVDVSIYRIAQKIENK